LSTALFTVSFFQGDNNFPTPVDHVSDGSLNFCWRLILTPEHVVDYVVAHEVAHLKHMNHGPHFWALTARLTENPEIARAWLRQHGDRVLRYG